MIKNEWLFDTSNGKLDLTPENRRKIYAWGLKLMIDDQFSKVMNRGSIMNFNLNLSYTNNSFNRQLMFYLEDFTQEWSSTIEDLSKDVIKDIVEHIVPFNGDVIDNDNRKYHVIVVSQDNSQAVTIKR